jgi:hypothetical protein
LTSKVVTLDDVAELPLETPATVHDVEAVGKATSQEDSRSLGFNWEDLQAQAIALKRRVRISYQVRPVV